jgi:superfamily II DNA/RNA helicase
MYKVVAFYFSMIHKILEDGCDSNGGDVPQKPQAVIIAPTRELAIQIKVIY